MGKFNNIPKSNGKAESHKDEAKTNILKNMKKLLLMALFMCILFLVKAQIGYEKSIEFGVSIGLDNFTKSSFEIEMLNGYRFNDYFFLGIGAGFRYTDALYYKSRILGNYFESRDGKYLIPLYVRVKANLTKTKISPFLLANVGYTFDVGQNPNKNTYGFMFEPAFGIDFNLNEEKLGLYFLVGFNLQNAEYMLFGYDSEKTTGMASSIVIRGGVKF